MCHHTGETRCGTMFNIVEMGSDQSIEQLQTSQELKDWCYEAVDTLMNLDQKYAEGIEEVSKKAEPQNVRNLGSNVNKSMIIAGTSKVNITQKTVLETVVKTAFYVTSLNVLKVKPEVKLIMCDIIGLTNANANEAPMPPYSDPKYLLRVIGITDVKEAKIENGNIVYTTEGGESKSEPVEKIKEFIHKYYAATLKEKIEKSAPAIENISTNINVSVQNVGSNEINIKVRRSHNSTFNFKQSNESKIKMDVEMKELGQKLSDLRNKPPPASTPIPTYTGDPNSGVPPAAPNPNVQNNVQETRNQSESVKTSEKKTVKRSNDTKTDDGMDQNTMYIVVGCVIVLLLLGTVAVVVIVKRKQRRRAAMMMQQAQPVVYPMYGGYVHMLQ